MVTEAVALFDFPIGMRELAYMVLPNPRQRLSFWVKSVYSCSTWTSVIIQLIQWPGVSTWIILHDINSILISESTS